MNEKVIILVRGLPGAGKSSFAELLGTKAICTADDYFMHNNEYKWDVNKLASAHNWCQRKCKRFMKKQVERIVVANTNTRDREMKVYFDLAHQFGYKIFSVIVENRHNGINIHNVPVESIDKMKNRFSVKL